MEGITEWTGFTVNHIAKNTSFCKDQQSAREKVGLVPIDLAPQESSYNGTFVSSLHT